MFALPIKDNLPTERPPFVTLALIVANIVVFFVVQRAGFTLTGSAQAGATTAHYGVSAFELTHPGAATTGGPSPWLTPFTALFLHGGVLQLAGNMLFLWIFGSSIEDATGPVRFLVLYVLAGLAAVGLQVAIAPGETAALVGAQGAVAGVLGAYLVLYHRARVLTLVVVVLFGTLVAVPPLVFLFGWFAIQAAFGALDLTDPAGTAGAVAFVAHAGGLVLGALLIRALARRVRPVT